MNKTEKPGKLKRLIKWAAILLVLGVILVLLIPTLASTQFVKDKALGSVNSQIQGHISAASLSLSWSGAQTLSGVTITDPENREALTVNRIAVGPSLLGIAFKKERISLEIDQLVADLQLDENGVSNLQKALESVPGKSPASVSKPSPPDQPASPLKLDRDVEFVLKDSRVRIDGPSMTPIVTRMNLESLLDAGEGVFTLTAQAAAGNEGSDAASSEGRLNLDVRLDHLVDANSHLTPDQIQADVTATVQAFPVAFFDALLPLDGLLALALGNEINLDLKTSGDAVNNQIQLATRSDYLTLDLSLQRQADQLSLAKPGQLEFKATRKLVERITQGQELPLALSDDVSINVQLGQLNYSLKPEDLPRTSLGADITLTPLQLHLKQPDQNVTLASLKSRIESSSLAEGLSIGLNGQLRSGKEVKPVSLTVNSTQWFDAGGQINPDGPALHLESQLGIPVPLILGFLATDEDRAMVSAVLGAQMGLDLKADTDSSGQQFECRLDASHAQANLAGSLQGDRLRLSAPLALDQEISPELSQALLGKINPLLVSAVGSERPIQLRVDNEGFDLPLDDSGIGGAQIPSATLDLGKVILDNGGLLGRIVSLLQNRSLSQEKQLTAWFTPLRASVEKGVATYERSDALIGSSIHLSTWGKINLVNNQVNMILGLPADTLDDAFDIEGLPEDYVFQIPVTGTSAEPKVDWKQVGTQLAGLTATSELEGKLGDAGKLLSGFSSLLNKSAGKAVIPEMKPAPAAPELPWETK